MNTTCYASFSRSEKQKQRAGLLEPIKNTDGASGGLAAKGGKMGQRKNGGDGKGSKILPMIASMKLHRPFLDKPPFYRRNFSDPAITLLHKRAMLPPILLSRATPLERQEIEVKISPLKPWSGRPSERMKDGNLYVKCSQDYI